MLSNGGGKLSSVRQFYSGGERVTCFEHRSVLQSSCRHGVVQAWPVPLVMTSFWDA